MSSYIHLTKWWTLEIGRFKGRYIYEEKATDLRITESKTASFFQGRRPKARPKSVKTFLVGRNWLPWAAAELLPRKISYESGRATSPLRLRRRCLRNSSAVATNKTITNVCSCYARGLPANGFCRLTRCDKSSTSSYLETTQERSHSSAQSVTGASQ